MTVKTVTINSEAFSTQLSLPSPERSSASEPSRREVLTYAWGAALAVVGAQAAVAGFFFLRPRFRPGEFGGEFALGTAAALPAVDAPPKAMSEGKFWLVNTKQGPKALYMVCTHLGCLYKWEDSLGHFRCPCHGSEFSREGELLRGPATRALDQFTVRIIAGKEVLAQTSEKGTAIIPPAVLDTQAKIVVDTGRKVVGK